jgi:hypothetical protein
MSSFDRTKLGGGPHGKFESGFGNTLVGSEVAMKRRILRKAFKTNKVKTTTSGLTNKRSLAGPFRTAYNLGDPLGRKHLRCGGCSQVQGSKADGVSNADCAKVVQGYSVNEVPLQGNNNTFVADSSLYTQFKHLSSVNLTYNDKSGGGDESNSTFTALNRVRRG